jgi:hypothetical protein
MTGREQLKVSSVIHANRRGRARGRSFPVPRWTSRLPRRRVRRQEMADPGFAAADAGAGGGPRRRLRSLPADATLWQPAGCRQQPGAAVLRRPLGRRSSRESGPGHPGLAPPGRRQRAARGARARRGRGRRRDRGQVSPSGRAALGRGAAQRFPYGRVRRQQVAVRRWTGCTRVCPGLRALARLQTRCAAACSSSALVSVPGFTNTALRHFRPPAHLRYRVIPICSDRQRMACRLAV